MKKFFSKGNKGAALITVLITVSFIGILATSLMFMAYMNYQTKTVRYKSTDNFYTDELALDEIAVTLQQAAADGSSLAGARTNIMAKTGIGVWSNSGTGTYDPAVIEATCVARTTSSDVVISVESDNPVVEFNSKNFTLKNLKVIAERPSDGYRTQITTDLSVYFLNGGDSDMKVNDFSVITDNWIDVPNGSRIYEGNLYVENNYVLAAKRGQGGVYQHWNGKTDSSCNADKSCAMYLHNNAACVSLAAPKAIFVGDLVLTQGSAMSMAGDVTVFGNVYVQGSSMLSVSGKLDITGTLNVDGNSKVVGLASGRIHSNQTDIDWDALPHHEAGHPKADTVKAPGMVGLIFSPVYVYKQGEGWLVYNFAENDNQNIKPTYNSRMSGIKTKFNMDNPINASGADGALLLLAMNGTEYYWDPVTSTNKTRERMWDVRGELRHCTLLTRQHLSYSDEGASLNCYSGHLEDDEYAAARAVLYSEGGGGGIVVRRIITTDPTIVDQASITSKIDVKVVSNTYQDANISFLSGSNCDDINVIFPGNEKTNVWDKYVHDVCGGVEPAHVFENYTLCMKWDMEKRGTASNYICQQFKGSDYIYVYIKNYNNSGSGKNIVPTYYFIASNADQLITDVFKGIKGEEDPSQNYVIYNNWLKDEY